MLIVDLKKPGLRFAETRQTQHKVNGLNAYRDQPEHRSQIFLLPKDDQIILDCVGSKNTSSILTCGTQR
jgi:hypothetical protein